MQKKLYILMLIAATALASCSDELGADVSAPQQTERKLVPLSFVASLGGEDASATRVDYEYDNDKKGLKLTWSEKDQIGVYIKTADGIIVRAGSINNSDYTATNSNKTCEFKGLVSEKFDGEEYIYMHPDLGMKTYIDFENQYGYIGSTAHLDDYLPIVWRESGSSYTSSYQGYVLKLTMTFGEDPGSIRKVTLHTSRDVASGGSSNERVFPKQYNINSLGVDAPFTFTSVTPASAAPASTYTDAISLNILGTGMPVQTKTMAVDGVNEWTAVAYLANTQVNNLNVFNSKIRLEVLNHEGKTYTSVLESFKGQSGASNETLLSSTRLFNNGVHSMSRSVSSSGISPTIINYQYKVNSILGMWNEYGKPYDPNGLIYNPTTPTTNCASIPTQLSSNETAIKSRYKNAGTGASNTPNFMLGVYDTQNLAENCKTGTASTLYARQDNAVCNNITLTEASEVYLTFLSEYAWNQNLLGYYHYSGEAPSSGNDVQKNIVYPNLSKPGHEPFNTDGQPKNNIGKNEDAPLTEYETVKLMYIKDDGTAETTFPAGTTIGFFMMINVQANGFQQSQYSLLNWGQWRTFTNSAWNAENSRWSGAYARCNFFASADVCSDESGTPIPGLALYGMKDDATNNANTAYSTCLFMVSTSVPTAMQTQNKCYFNIGTGQLVINK